MDLGTYIKIVPDENGFRACIVQSVQCKIILRIQSLQDLQCPLTLVLLNLDIHYFANSVDPDQLASEEAN